MGYFYILVAGYAFRNACKLFISLKPSTLKQDGLVQIFWNVGKLRHSSLCAR